ncbi:MAG: hypothetical protein JW891_18160 [Candidatus Lokiarchaeota archaeon]|nr:hypothetical protein [Candidatus Lokiarchaeota archaeon]
MPARPVLQEPRKGVRHVRLAGRFRFRDVPGVNDRVRGFCEKYQVSKAQGSRCLPKRRWRVRNPGPRL